MLTITCPACRESLNVPDSLAGQTDTCPTCKRTIPIPAPKPPAPAEQPQQPQQPQPVDLSGPEDLAWRRNEMATASIAEHILAVTGYVTAMVATLATLMTLAIVVDQDLWPAAPIALGAWSTTGLLLGLAAICRYLRTIAADHLH